MFLSELELSHFRNYESCKASFPQSGFIFFSGRNGQGKSNLLEAVHFLATMRSFRGAQSDVVVQAGQEYAVVRGLASRSARELLIEMQIFANSKRSRVQVNKQAMKRSADLCNHLLVTIFSPRDLELIKGGPAFRRDYIDDVISTTSPSYAQLCADLERILRQRNTLLRQSGGKLRDDIISTLDVWDERLATCGEQIARTRVAAIAELSPYITKAYVDLSRTLVVQTVEVRIASSWLPEKDLKTALFETRATDVVRGVTTVGPHRDDVIVSLNDFPSRTHASQGEQRTLALALRLAAHRRHAQIVGEDPLLLLDDVFSELDDERSRALVENLPSTQAFVTSAIDLPDGMHPTCHYVVESGQLRACAN